MIHHIGNALTRGKAPNQEGPNLEQSWFLWIIHDVVRKVEDKKHVWRRPFKQTRDHILKQRRRPGIVAHDSKPLSFEKRMCLIGEQVNGFS